MARVPPELVEEVRARIDIVEIVSEHVTLRKAGRSFTGLCPFHTEKTPSFAVDPQKQLYHCFGCGAGGNVFGFLMAIEGLSFPEALRALARRAGVQLPSRGEGPDRLQPLYDSVRKAADLYRKELLHPERGKAARAYLAKRGLTDEVLEAFAVGWAPDQWDFLIKRLRAAGVAQSVLEQAGLVIRRQSSTGVYDRFRCRIVFPILTVSGAPVGFGGRILPGAEAEDGPDPHQPKYLNSPETPIYSKGRLLYGLHRARNPIREADTTLLVEGYTDVLRLHQEGFCNAVASSGTALTLQQARILVRYSPNVTLLMDGDEAGVSAARRAVGELLAAGADPRVALLPGEHDPDSFVVEEGGDGLRMLLDQAHEVIGFELARVGPVNSLDAESRLALGRRIAAHLARVGDALKRDVLTREAARAIGVGSDALASEVRRQARQGGRDEPPVGTPTRVARGVGVRPGELDRELVRAMIVSSEARSVLSREVAADEIADASLAMIVSELNSLGDVGPAQLLSQVLQRLPEPTIQSIVVALHEDSAPLENAEKLLWRLKRRRAEVRYRELRRELKGLEASGASEEEKSRLLEEILAQKRLASEPSPQ